MKIVSYIKKKYPLLGPIRNVMINPKKSFCEYRKKNKNIIVLRYHRVADLDYDPFGLAVTIRAFDEQMKYIKENYKLIRVDDNWENINEKSLIITFDDGYLDNYVYAIPILKKYDIPATFFISTQNIDKNKEFWDHDYIRMLLYRQENKLEIFNKEYNLKKINMNKLIKFLHTQLKQMQINDRNEFLFDMEKQLNPKISCRDLYRTVNKKELIEMSKLPNILIGAHTVTHTRLAIQETEVQEWEIKESKIELEKIINKPVEYFAYPFGLKNIDYNIKTVELLKKHGFKKAFTTEGKNIKINDNRYEIPRYGARNWNEKQIRNILDFYWKYR